MLDAIRKRLWKDQELSELAQDTQKAFDKIPETKIFEFTRLYAEPMLLSGMSRSPVEIRAGRVLLDATPETVVLPGAVHFTWIGSGARINKIDGLTVAVKYQFTLIATYGAS